MNMNFDKRCQKLQEQVQILDLLIGLARIDRNAIRSLVEDAKNQQNLLVPNQEQENWLANLRQDKLRRLAAKLQANQRYQAANIVNKNDVAIARRALNWPSASPFKQPPKKPLPVIRS